MNVTYEESINNRLINKIRDRGYVLASIIGKRELSRPDHRAIGILKPVGGRFRRGLFRIHGRRDLFIAIIWIDNRLRGASPNNLIIEVMGREFVNEMMDFAKEIAEDCNVNIRVRLIRDAPRLEEGLWEGFDMR